MYYTEPMPRADEGPFLAEERKLLDAISERIGHFVSRRRLQRVLAPTVGGAPAPEWWVVLDFLRQTDRALLGRLGRKMINHLCWNGVEAAERLLRSTVPARTTGDEEIGDDNRPRPRAGRAADPETTEAAFRIAGLHLPEDEILNCIHRWIREDKSTFLKNALERMDTPLAEVADALQRFRHGGVNEEDLSVATQTVLRAALVRRFLTDQLEFVNIAKEYLRLSDFHELCQRIVYPPRSHGRLGGKAAGLFLASRIVARSPEYKDDPRRHPPAAQLAHPLGRHPRLHPPQRPRGRLQPQVRRPRPGEARLPLHRPAVQELVLLAGHPARALRRARRPRGPADHRAQLEPPRGPPRRRRSPGKYKSLFLPNTGSKRERLAALTDAIAEVYASVFSPDPIEYRAGRGLLDLHEEMGILIQEVVGTRIGPYWLPAFSGVGFSNNEFRWSARIKREDGLLRIVPGLGTRAVDRLADDYPVLIAPGQPGLRVNQTPDEAARYSPKQADVINVETGRFETVDVHELLKEHGDEMPLLRQMISIADHDHLRRPVGLVDMEGAVVTFEGLFSETPFIARMRTLLQRPAREAADAGGHRVRLGRPQRLPPPVPAAGSHRGRLSRSPFPRDLPADRVLFTARRYVSNGQVSDLSHVVYVDPARYTDLELDRIREVGRAVGRLNRLLPKRQFVLMGPGRWGSRGDIRLGVPVTYADISNSAIIIEIARKKGGYLPDLSFGTHFFQDLVEASIRYLPLYPDDPDVVFNEAFFLRTKNALAGARARVRLARRRAARDRRARRRPTAAC